MLHIEERTRGDVMVLRLSGQIVASASELEIRDTIRRVLVRGYRRVVVDLTGVTRADTPDDRLLLGALVDARGVGAELRLVHAPQRMTSLRQQFSDFESESDALDSFEVHHPA